MSARPIPTGEPARRRVWPRWVLVVSAILLATMLAMLVDRVPPGAAADGSVTPPPPPPAPPPLLNAFMLGNFTGNGFDGLYTATTAQQLSLQNLEQQAVTDTLKLHGLDAGDAIAVQSWARADAEADLWGLLVQAIQTPAASRTADQANAVAWLTAVQQRENVLAAQDAGTQYVAWQGLDPTQYQNLLNGSADESTLQTFFADNGQVSAGYCAYRSPAPYQDEYTGWDQQSCFTPSGGIGFSPTPPTYDQFTKWGQAAADPTLNSAAFVGVARNVAEAIALGGGVAGAGVAGAVIANTPAVASALSGSAFQQAVLPYAARVNVTTESNAVDAAEAAAEAAGEDTAAAAEEAEAEVAAEAAAIGGETAAASVAAIVVAVLEIINIVATLQLPGQLASGIVNARTTTPDLTALLGSAGGIGGLYNLFIGATLPTPLYSTCDDNLVGAGKRPCLNTPDVPAAANTDPLFAIQAQGAAATTYAPTLTWQDTASGGTTTARLHETWFVDTVSATGLPPTTTQTLRIGYTDWAGKEQVAWLFDDPTLGYRFLGFPKPDPSGTAMNPQTCIADKTCSYSSTIDYIGADGNKYSAGVVPPLAPQVTATVSANPVEGSPTTFTASATSPLGRALTYQWAFETPGQLSCTDVNDSFTCTDLVSAAPGAQAQYTFPAPGAYQARVTVTDTNGLATQETVTVQVGDVPPTVTLSPACPAAGACDARTVAPGSAATLTGTIHHAGPGDVETWTFDWGDGTVDQFPTVIITGAQIPLDLAISDTHTYATVGRHTVTVTATDAAGGKASATATEIVQGTTAVTWPAPAAITYGTPLGDAQLDATATVQGTSTGVAGAFAYRADGQSVTPNEVLPAGPHTLTAQFTPADPVGYTTPAAVSVPLTVNRAPLTVTAPSPNMVYGARTLPSLTAVAYSGFVNGEGAGALGGGLTCALTDSAGKAATLSAGLPAGTYTVACSGQTSSNYALTYKAGTLTVQPAPLTIAADDQTMPLHGAVPPLTVAYQGFVNGETAAALTAAPSCTTTATSASAAGSYPITCSGAADPNYAITYRAGTLQVLFQFGGFAAPLGGGAATPVFKAGSTIPIKFQLTDATGVIVQASTAPTFFASNPTSCGAGAVDATGTTAAGDTGTTFRWDSTSQQYVYNYHTDKSLAGMCQTITVTLADGTTHSVTMAFR